jgi:hypothetical protein
MAFPIPLLKPAQNAPNQKWKALKARVLAMRDAHIAGIANLNQHLVQLQIILISLLEKRREMEDRGGSDFLYWEGTFWEAIAQTALQMVCIRNGKFTNLPPSFGTGCYSIRRNSCFFCRSP